MSVGLQGVSFERVVGRPVEDAPRIVVTIENRDPIDLLDFTASLTALAREHEATMRATRPSLDIEETRLLVVDVRRGSIVLELLPALAPLVSTVEFANAAIQFVQHISTAFNILREFGGRLSDPTTQQLKNMNDMVQTIVKDTDGSLHVGVKHSDGRVIQEILIRRDSARLISENSQAQRKEIELEKLGAVAYPRVLMRLHQTSVEDLKVGKKASEKGIVESIDATPRHLIYVSDLAGQRIKDVILEPDGNPYQKGFVVDLDVETVSGRPRAYRILQVHEVIDLED